MFPAVKSLPLFFAELNQENRRPANSDREIRARAAGGFQNGKAFQSPRAAPESAALRLAVRPAPGRGGAGNFRPPREPHFFFGAAGAGGGFGPAARRRPAFFFRE